MTSTASPSDQTCTPSTTAAAAWYVAHTKPRQEHVALQQLQRQDFEVYLPLFRVFRKPGRRAAAGGVAKVSAAGVERSTALAAAGAAVIHEPMFPRYLFLRPTRSTQSLSVVRSTVGVSRLVMFGQHPATLADEAIHSIRKAESLRETASLDSISPYEPGMAVRLLDPALAGLQALVQSVSKDRVTLLLEILGRPQSVQVEFGRIAPL
ncbi:MAG: transcriptional activator RfaH [Castellaniella sp.]|uniref:transcription termination/antitermination protein NusG n=1 Tax=Castellaniella sp. TaxID=1955812 RepID=UPI001217CB66|nr:transcriptional activator RfaH [Castellaniella sp.]TAN25452.1 MAG: transcriptional activator RfaH [Castellaniella sp.]